MKAPARDFGSQLGSTGTEKTRLKRFLGFWTDLGYLGLGLLSCCALGLFAGYLCVIVARFVTVCIGTLN